MRKDLNRNSIKREKSISEIARLLKRNKSTISREIKRNKIIKNGRKDFICLNKKQSAINAKNVVFVICLKSIIKTMLRTNRLMKGKKEIFEYFVFGSRINNN